MSKDQLQFFRSILHERKKYILDMIDRLKTISQIDDSDLNMNKKYTDTLADQSTDSGGREESFMFMSRELQYLHRIDEALRSIESGHYGICKICGNEISRERLEAVPTTDTCFNCKNSIVKKIYLN